MDKISPMTNEQLRRLNWRCRRGLLELDIVLQRFSENHLAGLSVPELLAFDELLDLPDNDFLDVVVSRKEIKNITLTTPENEFSDPMQQVLKKLRTV